VVLHKIANLDPPGFQGSIPCGAVFKMSIIDQTEPTNAYDLSSGPAARAVRELELRREFRAKPSKKKPWEDPTKIPNPYDLSEVHEIGEAHKRAEDSYVNERL
jgi:hypothetical protein